MIDAIMNQFDDVWLGNTAKIVNEKTFVLTRFCD